MSDEYKLFTSYESLIKKLENDGINDYIKWLKENSIRINTPISWGKIMISPLCISVIFHHIDLLEYILKNGANIDGIMDNCVSYYTPIASVALIDEYYIGNKILENKLEELKSKNRKKLLDIKINIFEILILEGADINLLGLNGRNLLGLELGKPLTHIMPDFIEYIISKGLNPNINNFVTNKEIPLCFDNKSWMRNRKILHYAPKGNQCLVISLAWSLKPIIILLWSIIITHIVSVNDGKGDIFGLYLDISDFVKFVKKLCPDFPKFLLIQDIKNRGFKITDKELHKKSVHLFNILIKSGTNLKEKQSNGKTVYETIDWFKNGSDILSSIFKKYKVKEVLNLILKKINRNISTILKKNAKKDVQMIRQLAEAFKISLKNKDLNDKKTRKHVCQIITFLKENGNNIDKKFYNIILNLNEAESNNEQIIVGDDVYYYNNDEIITYPSNIIKGNKKQKIVHSFHISEIPELIRTGLNPYNREKFPKSTLKKWYDQISANNLPSTLPPISLKEIHQFNFNELVLSRNSGVLIKSENNDIYDFNDISNIEIRNLFKKNYKPGLSLNLVVNNIAKDKNIRIKFANIFKATKYIKISKKIMKITRNIPGYGIYDKKYDQIHEFKKIEKWVNSTSIGRYIDLVNIIKKWPYPLFYNFFIMLATYKQPIMTSNNWNKLIHNFWKKRTIYAVNKMEIFYREIFFHLIISGCSSGEITLPFIIGIIRQLNSEFEMIQKLKIFISNNYNSKDYPQIFKDLEDTKLKLIGTQSINKKYPEIFAEILAMFGDDENTREIFSLGPLFDKQWVIINSENPGMEYFMSTVQEYDRSFLEIQWAEFSEEEKEPFLDATNVIKNNIYNKINIVWKEKIQDLFYLLTPHNGTYNLRYEYFIF